MVKKIEIPPIFAFITNMKYIGPYLEHRLNIQNIFTCRDLVERLETFGQVWENEVVVRSRVKYWLTNLLKNRRSLQCCRNNSRIIHNQECSYKARKMNFKAYNAVIKLWAAYAVLPFRKWRPRLLRGYNQRNKFPRICIV